MSDEVKEAMRTVIAYLDEQMEQGPSPMIAKVSNYLQAELDENG